MVDSDGFKVWWHPIRFYFSLDIRLVQTNFGGHPI